MASTKTTKPRLTLHQVERDFATDEQCKALLTKLRWPDGIATCPRCGETKRVYALRTRPFHWVCKNPSEKCPGVYRFSVLTGTVFENTNVPLSTWFRVAFLMVSSKKGISALQVHRMIDPVRGKKGSYKTAWYMCHRLRAAMQDGTFRRLTGEVEVDETFVGGKDRNRHWNKKSAQVRAAAGPQMPGKAIGYGKVGVTGAIARKGNVVAQVIGDLRAETKADFVRKVVSDKVELVVTDENHAYDYVRAGMPHEAVNHSEGEYVRGNVHTNNIETFWSLLKPGVVGTYHKVSKDYLPLYLNEFAWRYNHRNDREIFHAVLAGC